MSNICQLIIRNFYLQKPIFATFVFRTPVGDQGGSEGRFEGKNSENNL